MITHLEKQDMCKGKKDQSDHLFFYKTQSEFQHKYFIAIL